MSKDPWIDPYFPPTPYKKVVKSTFGGVVTTPTGQTVMSRFGSPPETKNEVKEVQAALPPPPAQPVPESEQAPILKPYNTPPLPEPEPLAASPKENLTRSVDLKSQDSSSLPPIILYAPPVEVSVSKNSSSGQELPESNKVLSVADQNLLVHSMRNDDGSKLRAAISRATPVTPSLQTSETREAPNTKLPTSRAETSQGIFASTMKGLSAILISNAKAADDVDKVSPPLPLNLPGSANPSDQSRRR